LTCVLKRERYADDPRRIEAIRIDDGPRGEELEIECTMFTGLPGELALN